MPREAGAVVRIIDQRQLPWRFATEDLRKVDDVARAIRDMHVRGAGCIGATAACGMWLARENGEDVGAQRGDPVLHRLLGAGPEGHHGDHRAHADDDAQHGEQGPELVRPDRPEGHRHRLAQQHVSAPRPTAAAVAACRARPRPR